MTQHSPRRRERSNRPTPTAVRVAFIDPGSRVEARLGAVTGAVISILPDGVKFTMQSVVDLPQVDRRPRPATNVNTAIRAVEERVKQWCEAAGLRSVTRD